MKRTAVSSVTWLTRIPLNLGTRPRARNGPHSEIETVAQRVEGNHDWV